MVSVLASSAIDCGYELRSGQTKECKIGMCCFSAKNASLRRLVGSESSIQNHDHSVEGDLANANSAQTVLYFFLLMLYRTSTCKILYVLLGFFESQKLFFSRTGFVYAKNWKNSENSSISQLCFLFVIYRTSTCKILYVLLGFFSQLLFI
jgi:hypothetical protein